MELANTGNALEAFTNGIAPSGEFHETVRFPNGRGVSIVRNGMSYGRQNGLFEVAVLDANGSLDYSTPVTSDVLGWQTVGDVLDVMKQVADLPSATAGLTTGTTAELEG